MFKKTTYIGILTLFILLFAAAPASAHSLMMVTGENISDAMEGNLDNYWIRPGTTQSIVIVSGHGFEYEFVDSPTPLNITIVLPDGKTETITSTTEIENIDMIFAGTKEPYHYQKINYTFTQEGTYYFYTTAKIENVTEYSKMMIYVGENTWDDWDKSMGYPFEFMPYTRISGLSEGDVIHGKLVSNGTGIPNIKYYAEPIKNATEAKRSFNKIVNDYSIGDGESVYLIYSKRSMTDENGNFVTAVPEQGVWMFVASGGTAPDGTPYKSTFTVPVLPQFYGQNNKTAPSTPGFGMFVSLIALIGIVLIIRRK